MFGYALTLIASGLAVQTQGHPVEQPLSQPTVMTIYQTAVGSGNGFATVRENRTLHLNPGENAIVEEGLPVRLDPYSVDLQPLNPDLPFTVLEQNFRYDLLDLDSVLKAAVGNRVFVNQVLPDGSHRRVEGTLLNAPIPWPRFRHPSHVSLIYWRSIFAIEPRWRDRGPVVRTDDGDVLVNPKGTLEVASVPEGLQTKPALHWVVQAENSGDHPYRLSYITDDIGWEVAYVLTIDSETNRADLEAWTTIRNESGMDYRNVMVQLIAGRVNRNRPRPIQFDDAFYIEDPNADFLSAGAHAVRESLGDYYLYTYGRRVDLPNNSLKQISLFQVEDIAVEPRVVEYPRSEEQWFAYLFSNSESNNLGFPLPAGWFRVFVQEPTGKRFVGESFISNTPREEEVWLTFGLPKPRFETRE
jgi:hypothetical protein